MFTLSQSIKLPIWLRLTCHRILSSAWLWSLLCYLLSTMANCSCSAAGSQPGQLTYTVSDCIRIFRQLACLVAYWKTTWICWVPHAHLSLIWRLGNCMLLLDLLRLAAHQQSGKTWSQLPTAQRDQLRNVVKPHNASLCEHEVQRGWSPCARKLLIFRLTSWKCTEDADAE